MRLAACALAIVFVSAAAPVALAADLRVLAAPEMRSVMPDLAAQFRQATGHRIAIGYGAADVAIMMRTGEKPDLVIAQRAILDELAKSGKIPMDAGVDIACSRLALMVKAGAPQPDIGSADKLKDALLAAPSIAAPRPGWLAGFYFDQMLRTLGLTEQLKARIVPVDLQTATIAGMVAKGAAAMGIEQRSQAYGSNEVELLALPPDVEIRIAFAAAVGPGAQEKDAAAAFVAFLKSPAAAALTAKGFDAL